MQGSEPCGTMISPDLGVIRPDPIVEHQVNGDQINGRSLLTDQNTL